MYKHQRQYNTNSIICYISVWIRRSVSISNRIKIILYNTTRSLSLSPSSSSSSVEGKDSFSLSLMQRRSTALERSSFMVYHKYMFKIKKKEKKEREDKCIFSRFFIDFEKCDVFFVTLCKIYATN